MIRVEKTHLPVAAMTHPGMKGKNNEDRFGVSAFRMKTQPVTPVLLAVLSDGIGGHRAGEVASELAVNTISQYVAQSDGRNPTGIMTEAIQFASQAIFEQAQENYEQQGMGATCAVAWIAGDRLYTATVGDSRIYLMRGGTIRQLSTDHTWIQEALERGLIQPDEIIGHPNAHVIRRYLGSPIPPEVDFRVRTSESEASPEDFGQGMTLQPQDCLLLCSDGLTDLVSDEEILAGFSTETMETAGQQLVNLANERGGHDNITLIAIRIPEVHVGAGAAAPVPVDNGRTQQIHRLKPRHLPQHLPQQSPQKQPMQEVPQPAAQSRVLPRRLLIGCLGVVILAVLVGSVAGGWILYSGRYLSTPTPTRTLQSTVALPGAGSTGGATPTRTPTRTSTPFFPAASTPPADATPVSPGLAPGVSPSITPWRVNSPTPALPIVTVRP